MIPTAPFPIIEILENRIAPATLVHPGTVTYTDTEGELVTVKVSHGDLTGRLTFDTAFNAAGDQQLQKIDLTDASFAHANLTITVQKAAGDGLVNIGFVDATGNDLGTVAIQGDLGKIMAGDAKFTTAGLKTLTLGSFGAAGTGSGAPDLNSTIEGGVGSVKIEGNMDTASLTVDMGSIGTISIGGSLLGGATDYSGYVESSGKIGTVTVMHDVKGGTGAHSGEIYSAGALGKMVINGSLLGGSNDHAGRIDCGSLGTLQIGGDVVGGQGDYSASVYADGKLAKAVIGGSLIGGGGQTSGHLEAAGAMPSVVIQKNMIGGAKDFSGSVRSDADLGSIVVKGMVQGGGGTESARIYAVGKLGQVKIIGDLQGGAGPRSGSIYSDGVLSAASIGGAVQSGVGAASGSILSGATLAKITIAGSATGSSASPVIISGGGPLRTNGSKDLAIGSVTLHGDATFLQILGGYDRTGANINADAQIGTVKVGGNWAGSDVVAGASAGADGLFGTADDTKGIGAEFPKAVSQIASILIGGQILPTPGGGTAHHGFVAEDVISVKIGKNAVVLHKGPGNDHLVPVGSTGDLVVQEV